MAKPKNVTVIEALDQVGSPVAVRGWVHTIRDMGKIAFIEVRDHTGLLQVVVDDPSTLPKLGNEFVVAVRGEIRKRGERYINKNLATGAIELGAQEITVLNESAELPFEIKKDTMPVHEELRLQYRYLDLRSERMANNLKLRHKVTHFLYNYFNDHGFIGVDTPILAKGTPEGSREFLVPSRLHAEKFYVLPQSPQQFKQLLMVGGVGRYYQMARIFRDEDSRADRQPEAVQIDFEMSFVEQEEILQLVEDMIINLVKNVAPDKKLLTPFPRIPYAESIKKYGNDKPDLRKDPNDKEELAFCWVIDFPMFEMGEESKKIEAVHHPFTSPASEDIGLLDKDPLKARAAAYDLVLNGIELSSGSIRIHDRELQNKVFGILGLSKQETETRFGHMLEAFTFGAPPHGGMALGIDRLVMKLAGEDNIREVSAFPKTGDGRDPLMHSPDDMPERTLSESHIKTIPPKKSK